MSDADIREVRRRLEAKNGGYEIVHASPGLEIGVYVLVAPEPDRQQPHEDDEVYVVLEGRGVLEVENQSFPLAEGSVHFVPAEPSDNPVARGVPVSTLSRTIISAG
jgi:mannose-6-phosphate isomerase-like protein (cupin superfamily)